MVYEQHGSMHITAMVYLTIVDARNYAVQREPGLVSCKVRVRAQHYFCSAVRGRLVVLQVQKGWHATGRDQAQACSN